MKSVWTQFLHRIAPPASVQQSASPDSAPHQRRARWSRLVLQRFEERVVPATKTWALTTGGDWEIAANWSPVGVPTTGDDIVIPDIGTLGSADQTIWLNTTKTINSLTTFEDFSVNSGITLTLTGRSGNQYGAEVSSVSSPIGFNAGSGAANQLVTTDSSGFLNLWQASLRQSGTSHTVTFADGVSVRGYGTIGQVATGYVAGTWVNAGTIASSASNNTLTLAASNTFENLPGGDFEAASGANFVIAGTVQNTGQMLTLDGPGNYVLTGTIVGGTIQATNGAILQGDGGTLDGVTIAAGTTFQLVPVTGLTRTVTVPTA